MLASVIASWFIIAIMKSTSALGIGLLGSIGWTFFLQK